MTKAVVERSAATPEFRARERTYSRLLVNFLAGVTLLYGLVLTLTLPWSIKEAIVGEEAGEPPGGLAYLWGMTLALVGALTMVRWLVVQALAFYEHDRLRRGLPRSRDDDLPRISILVPAYNESDTIDAAIASLVALDYPHYEVIVVDDGSSDDTYLRARPWQGTYERCKVEVHSKRNGGKWSALNFAYARASTDLLLCVDADSGLAKDALRWLVPRLEEPGVVGVSGQVTIRNRVNLLTRLQAVEYIIGNGGMRMALSCLGLVTVVPGPIGLYTREIMERISGLPGNAVPDDGQHGGGGVAGPLSPETFAEDFQLSLSALCLGGKIVYEPRAFAYTKCPERVDALINQRYRWIRGTWQVYGIYARRLRSLSRRTMPRLPRVMTLTYPFDIYIAPVFTFLFWASVAGSVAVMLPLDHVLAFVMALWVLNLMTTMVYIFEQDDEIGLIALVPLLELYGLLMNGAWVIAAVDELRGTRMRWS